MPPTQRTHSTTSAPFSLLTLSNFNSVISTYVFITNPPGPVIYDGSLPSVCVTAAPSLGRDHAAGSNHSVPLKKSCITPRQGSECTFLTPHRDISRQICQ